IRRHTRSKRDWSSDVCSSDLIWRLGSIFCMQRYVLLYCHIQELSDDYSRSGESHSKILFWTYLPEEIINQIEEKLLPACIRLEKENLEYDELVHSDIHVIKEQLKEKRLK